MRGTKAIGAVLAVVVLGLGATVYQSTIASERTTPSPVRLEDVGNAFDPAGPAGPHLADPREGGGNSDGPQRQDRGTQDERSSQARPAPPPPPCPAGEDTETGEDADDECDHEDDADEVDDEDDEDDAD